MSWVDNEVKLTSGRLTKAISGRLYHAEDAVWIIDSDGGAVRLNDGLRVKKPSDWVNPLYEGETVTIKAGK